MNTDISAAMGRVASLHLHPAETGQAMCDVGSVQLVTDKGILGDLRYYNRVHPETGNPTTRQVSLMAREQIEAHATTLGVESIPAGAVRANIETTGLDLTRLVGREIQVGEALLVISSLRQPCKKMDGIHEGLCQLMKDGKQGVVAQVVRSGHVRVGDEIRAQGDWSS